MSSDSVGPATSGPCPCSKVLSVARRWSPVACVLLCTAKFLTAKCPATSAAMWGGVDEAIPSGRLMSSAWTTTSPSHAQ